MGTIGMLTIYVWGMDGEEQGGTRPSRLRNDRTLKSAFPFTRPLNFLDYNIACSITMSKLDFETATKQEVTRLEKLHPTPEDLPGCMSMFDTFLSCNGAYPVKRQLMTA